MFIRHADVLVVGTGFGAAAPALRLAQAGLRVVMLEKGSHIDPRADFRQTQDPQYLLKYLRSLSGDHLNLTYAEGLGGGSSFYEMVSLRAPTKAFDQVDPRGRPLWPAGVDRRALDPYYDLAERMLNVEQIQPHEVPKSGLVFSLMMKNLGYSCDRARYAVRNCLGSGFCTTGCIYGAKQSLHMNYLPQAAAAGVSVVCDIEALSIHELGDPRTTAAARDLGEIPARYDVLCRTQDGGLVRYRAKLVILGGGTVGSARLLLASRPYLGLLSDHVGRNIAFNGSVKAVGVLPAGFPEGDMFAGRSHPGMISYEFLDSRGFSISAGKPLPLQVVAAARLRLDGEARQPDYWGQANVDLMKQYRHRMIVLVTFGLTAPGGVLEVDERATLRLRLDPTHALRRYHDDTEAVLHDILRRNGCEVVRAQFVQQDGAARPDLFFATSHQVGSCRMAVRRSEGVVDAAGEVFDHPGLYVSDGAAIPSSLAVNTSLTILANAERVAAGIVARYGLSSPVFG